MMRYLIILSLLLFPQLFPQRDFDYYDQDGKPTDMGIKSYVYMNEHRFAQEYMNFIGDTLYGYDMRVDNLSEYTNYDSLELGRYYYPDLIIITNEKKFMDYAVDSLSDLVKMTTFTNRFIKGCIYHELTHIWIQQIISEMKYHNEIISPENNSFGIYHRSDHEYGIAFIEEGICEYVAHKAGEILSPEEVIPDFDMPWDSYEIKYQYAEYYVRNMLDRYENVKKGIKDMLLIQPPAEEEIRNPELYYERFID